MARVPADTEGLGLHRLSVRPVRVLHEGIIRPLKYRPMLLTIK